MTPGDADHAQTELDLADQALRSARLLLDADALEDATSRMYFAVFHAAGAALMVEGLYAKTHSGQIALFDRTFGTTPLLNQLFGWRLDADYPRDRHFKLSEESVREVVSDAAAFVERCRTIVQERVAQGSDEPDPPPDL